MLPLGTLHKGLMASIFKCDRSDALLLSPFGRYNIQIFLIEAKDLKTTVQNVRRASMEKLDAGGLEIPVTRAGKSNGYVSM